MKKYISMIRMKTVPPKKRAEILQGDSQNGIKIGNHCEIHGDVNFGSEPYLIEIGDYVRIARGVSFVTHDGGMWVLRNNGMLKDADYFGRIIIGNNVHIGINAIIMPGVMIGDNVIIGAGSIVTRNIQDNCIAAGVPARVIRDLDDYYYKYIDKVDYTKHLKAKDKKKFLLEKYFTTDKVGIIILNYNTPYASIDCIKSIMDTYQGEYHIYLVDNNSQDSSLEIFFEAYHLSDKVTVIAQEQNRGYAAGNNVGLIKAMIEGCRYLMICNSDIVFLKRSIQSLVDFLVCEIDAGVVVPATFNRNLKNTTMLRKSATKLWHLIVQTTFLKHSLKKLRNRVIVRHENIKYPTKVDVVSGCCLLLKRELIDEIGLFDENTFLYSEEYILERKISTTKYKTYFVPYARVIHNHGESTNCNLNFAYIKSVESILYYAKEYLKLSMPKRIILYLLKSIGYIKMNLFKHHFFHLMKQYLVETLPSL